MRSGSSDIKRSPIVHCLVAFVHRTYAKSLALFAMPALAFAAQRNVADGGVL